MHNPIHYKLVSIMFTANLN